VDEQAKRARFEEMIMPHLDAAYNLARWLTRNEHDAQDVVQDAFLRAFKFFEGFHGTNSRSWLLSIVRNASYNWLQKNRKNELTTVFDEELHGAEAVVSDPLAPLLRDADQRLVRQAMEELPVEFREVMILRELEGMSYKEIAELTEIPIGTVMSRLARARKQLQAQLTEHFRQERSP
jgi:RNA polymerase sigma-70 factor (ECF subfamily)